MPLHRRLLPILAMLMVACAQVFGLQQGYLCEHNGRAVQTMVDHHHVGDDLHAWHLDEGIPHHHSEHEEHDTVPHAPLKVELEVPQSPGAISAPSLVLWETPDWQNVSSLQGIVESAGGPLAHEPLERPPSIAWVVTKSVVLRM